MNKHISTLDGLRGLAALAVLLGHAGGLLVLPLLPSHGWIAVDLFFVLSGFVLARAYEDGMRVPGAWKAFATARFVRLWPMIVMGATLGAVVTAVAWGRPNIAPLWGMAVLCLPHIWVGELFPLNTIQWSLFYEVAANAAHCLFVWRLSTRRLGVAVMIAYVVLLAGAQFVVLAGGSTADTAWIGLARVSFGYLAGVLLYRLRDRLPVVRIGVAPIYLAALVMFAIPETGLGRFIDPLLIALCPVIVWLGANAKPAQEDGARFAGALSYPLYLVHYPILLLVNHSLPPDAGLSQRAAAGLLALVTSIVVACGALYAERHARAALGGWFQRRAAAAA
jgi:peptidoglycan/LPS O-acetylase OafA/YrhL